MTPSKSLPTDKKDHEEIMAILTQVLTQLVKINHKLDEVTSLVQPMRNHP